MAVNDCPHCGKPAVTFVTKSMLGPARSTTCVACGERISVGWSAMWIVAPILAGLWFGQAAGINLWVIMLAVLVVSTVLYWYFVPLVKR